MSPSFCKISFSDFKTAVTSYKKVLRKILSWFAEEKKMFYIGWRGVFPVGFFWLKGGIPLKDDREISMLE